ncbi:polysaccharide deacetylase family protein [Candidatus Parcubacteria bacterium]|nr:polysaccharide deacetylase family protein [Candidatus Parcubacteria bacterium]
MITWINFLHLYQPPHQNGFVFGKIVDESYRRIVRILNLDDDVNFTMNVSGSLLEQLDFYQKNDVINGLKKAYNDGKIELVSSAMYHPILPLLDRNEVKRQINLNNEILKKYFGADLKLKGFYMPEMCYSREVAEVVKEVGFQWIILDEISKNGKLGQGDIEKVFEIENLGLKIVFRNRKISDSFVPQKINEISGDQEDRVVITATDGELYGHHHWDLERHLEENFANRNIKRLKISDYIEQFKDLEKIDPVDSCWESSVEDLKNNIPYSFWYDPQNKLQKMLWDLALFSINTVEENQKDKGYEIARSLVDRGLTSCTFWSASGKRSFIWQDVIWNPDMIESGALNLVRAIRSLEKLDTKKRIKAEKMFLNIIENIWSSHWKKHYQNQ